MRFPGVAKHAVKALVISVLLAAYFGAPASAQNVQLLICPQQPESYAFISNPLSDTVVDAPALKLEGNVSSISQVEVYIDDAYNNTVAVGLGETSFATDISIGQGTHTVKIVAQDNCFPLTHEDSVVITYHPKVAPGNGGDTDTAVGDRRGRGHAVAGATATSSGDQQDVSTEAASPDSGRPGLRLPAVVETLLGTNDNPTGEGAQLSPSDVLKPAAVLAGIVTAFALPSLIERGRLDPLLNWLWYRPKGLKPRKLKRVDPARSRAIRVIGAVLIIVPFIV